MFQKARSRLTYANVMSTLSVFLVLGGGAAYAANTIGSADVIDNSLLTQDIKDGQVGAFDLGTDSVTSPKLAPDSVRTQDILNGTVSTSDIRTGAVTTARVADGSLRGEDVAADSLKGGHIDEATLAGVDAETFNGLPSYRFIGKEQNFNFTAQHEFANTSEAGRVPLYDGFYLDIFKTGQEANEIQVCQGDEDIERALRVAVWRRGATPTTLSRQQISLPARETWDPVNCDTFISEDEDGTGAEFMIFGPGGLIWGIPQHCPHVSTCTRWSYQVVGLGN